VTAALAIERLEKRFAAGGKPAVDGVSFDVPGGRDRGAAGPLGLRQDHDLALRRRLEHPTGRRISIGDRVVSSPSAACW
jgi:iron(III) transport system ATP-binding protein